MTLAYSEPTLKAELESIQDGAKDTSKLQCRAWAPSKERRCGKSIGKAEKVALLKLLPETIGFVSKDSLRVISTLVICRNNNHRNQANGLYELWLSMMVPDEPKDGGASQITTGKVECILSEPKDTQVPIKSPTRTRHVIAKPLFEPTDKPLSRQPSNSSLYLSAAEEWVDDSGDIFGDGHDGYRKVKIEVDMAPNFPVSQPFVKQENTLDDPFIITPNKPPPLASMDSGISMGIASSALITPIKPPPLASMDSGISMGYTSPVNFFELEDDDEAAMPSSPLDKASKKNERQARAQESRPDPTPVQTKSPEVYKAADGEVESATDEYIPFKHPSAELIKYIQEPLGATDIGENEVGYLYVFQIAEHSYNKIGYTNQKSVKKRMTQHKPCGWADPMILYLCRVPHAHRVEQIIHKHFQDRRLTQNLCKGKAGRKCDHNKHHEWFNVKLDEIWRVAIAWCHWIKSDPYPLSLSNERTLSQHWRRKLAQVECCEEHWLMWIYQHVPGSQSLTGLNLMEVELTKEGQERRQKERDKLHEKLEKQRKALKNARNEPIVVPEGPSIAFLRTPIKQNTFTDRVTYDNDLGFRQRLSRALNFKF